MTSQKAFNSKDLTLVLAICFDQPILLSQNVLSDVLAVLLTGFAGLQRRSSRSSTRKQ